MSVTVDTENLFLGPVDGKFQLKKKLSHGNIDKSTVVCNIGNK